MQIVIPKTVTEADIVATNLVEDASAYPGLTAFNAAATYAKDAFAYVSATMMIYKSMKDANLGHYPPSYLSGTDTTWWVEMGPLNRLAMFDTLTSTQSKAPASDPSNITMTIKAALCDSIFFANLSATNISITLKDGAGTVRGSKSMPLVYRWNITSFYKYLTSRFYTKTNALLTFGKRWDSTIDLTIHNSKAGATAACGRCTLGERWMLGRTKYGCDIAFKDYSDVKFDVFGQSSVITRDKANYIECSINSLEDDVTLDELNNVLRQVQSTPTVWDFNNATTKYDCMATYGISNNTVITPESLKLRTGNLKVTALL